jgi:hypothetical protein
MPTTADGSNDDGNHAAAESLATVFCRLTELPR